ncbi:Major Facilitator superfamily [Musa troglodytarum]|uniref:Molybdate-anion transporter n=2 Tax=Musa troglodytarum TaxID=320322 RepID=A0A9E7F3U4_9LILI|nr:Major Facilitator superfamily [Musa troglodytarum]
MEVFYYLLFGGLVAAVAAMELGKTRKDRVAISSAFSSFRNNFLLVYSLMMAGDWLQDPYVYYLYIQYGFNKGDIGRLFIAGFGSSMLFGTIVASLADKQGRKSACVTYCITYILSCMTKHSPDYKVLMVGRILAGISTSLLFSAFESWLVAEHNKRGFEPQWLSVTFSKAILLGNGLIAIVSGLFATLLIENLELDPVLPFDAAACFLAIGMAIILSSWSENYGDPSESNDLIAQFNGAAAAIASGKCDLTSVDHQNTSLILGPSVALIVVLITDEKIALLGAIQSLFEGSMYTVAFLYAPALSPNDEEIPRVFIFATFVLSSMLGSSIASRLMTHATLKVESYMRIVFLISAFTLLLPIVSNFLAAPSVQGDSISFGGCILLLGFCVFEACVGIFWPSIMMMRSQYIPEEARSTIMNLFRIPLNIFVCVVLYNVNAFPVTIMFGMCSIFLFVASVLQKRLMSHEFETDMKEGDDEAETRTFEPKGAVEHSHTSM